MSSLGANKPVAFAGRGGLLLMVCLLARPAMAQAPELSLDHRQVALLMRALAYEQRLPARAGLDIHIGVLGKAEVAASEQAARSMALAFQALGSVTLQGLPLRTSLLSFTNTAALAELLEQRGIDVLYICPGLGAELGGILELTRKRLVLSIAGEQAYVARGASLGVFTVEGSPTVFVNLAASKKEGAAFGSALLRLAKVVR